LLNNTFDFVQNQNLENCLRCIWEYRLKLRDSTRNCCPSLGFLSGSSRNNNLIKCEKISFGKQRGYTIFNSGYQAKIFNSMKGFHFLSSPTYSPFFIVNCSPFSRFQKRTLFVLTESTPNPESLKFKPGVPVLALTPDGKTNTLNYPSYKSAQKSPLAKLLFQIEGVKNVFFSTDYISITKTNDVDWAVLKPQVYAKLMEFFSSGKPIVSDEIPTTDTTIKETDSEVVQMIKEILETRVRAAVQEDGGDIIYKGFEDGVVFLKMQGSCSGCPSSAVTLKSGIEKMLMHWIPEVTGVVAIDDEELEKINLNQFQKTEEKLSQLETTAKP